MNKYINLCYAILSMAWLTIFGGKLYAQFPHAQVKNTEDKVEHWLRKGDSCLNTKPHQAEKIAHQTLDLSYQIKYRKGIIKSHGLLGKALQAQGVHDRALDHFLQQLNFYQESDNWLELAKTHNQISWLYWQQRNSPKALEYAKQALNIAQKYDYKEEIAFAYNTIGITHFRNKNYPEAKKYFKASLELREKAKIYHRMISSYNNLGLVFSRMNQHDEALKWFQKSLAVNRGKIEIKQMRAATLDNIGDVMANKGNIEEAKKYYAQSIEVASKAKANVRIIETYESFYKLFVKTKEYKNALSYYLLYTKLRDSLMSSNTDVKMTSLQHKYEIMNERKERALLEKDIDLQKAKVYRHKIISYGTVVGLLLMLILAFVLYKSSRRDRKARQLMRQKSEEINEINRLLINKREELLKRTQMLSLRNQEVTASIRSAKLIQSAILPFEQRMEAMLGEHFLIYMPKDIVSGDFYWIYQIGEVRYVAVADCTGHGVPGSLMSMLGYALLNEIVNKKIESLGSMLHELNLMLIASLRQEVTKNQAGMDIIVCKIAPANNEESTPSSFNVTYTGSRRPLYYTQEGELIKVKCDKQFIGGYFSRAPRPFEEQQITLNKGEQLYLTTDGFADTPNPNRRSFNNNRFFDLLKNNMHLPLAEQKTVFLSALAAYQQDAKQRDDITVLGFKL